MCVQQQTISYIFKYFMVTNSLPFHVFLISTTFQQVDDPAAKNQESSRDVDGDFQKMRRQDPHHSNFHHFHLFVFGLKLQSDEQRNGDFKDANLSVHKDPWSRPSSDYFVCTIRLKSSLKDLQNRGFTRFLPKITP